MPVLCSLYNETSYVLFMTLDYLVPQKMDLSCFLSELRHLTCRFMPLSEA